MSDLSLIESKMFGEVQCDFYSNSNKDEVWMTRRQIGEALGYSNANRAISDIHNRHKERFADKSRLTQIALPSGGVQELYVYNRKGMMEVCRWSEQPKADIFIDWVWDVIDEIMKTGNYKLPQTYPEALRELADKEEKNQKLIAENNTLKPKANKYDEFMNAEGLISVKGAAHILDIPGVGQNKLFEILRDEKIFYKKGKQNKVYQKYINRGYFKVKENPIEIGDNKIPYEKILFTPKGVSWISDYFKENNYKKGA